MPPGYLRDIVERVTPSVLVATRAGRTSVEQIEGEHVAQTCHLIADRSAIIAERISDGRLAIVGAEYHLAHGAAQVDPSSATSQSPNELAPAGDSPSFGQEHGHPAGPACRRGRPRPDWRPPQDGRRPGGRMGHGAPVARPLPGGWEPRRRPAGRGPAPALDRRAPICSAGHSGACSAEPHRGRRRPKPLPRDTCGTVEVGEVSRHVDVVGYAVDTRRCRWYQVVDASVR